MSACPVDAGGYPQCAADQSSEHPTRTPASTPASFGSFRFISIIPPVPPPYLPGGEEYFIKMCVVGRPLTSPAIYEQCRRGLYQVSARERDLAFDARACSL